MAEIVPYSHSSLGLEQKFFPHVRSLAPSPSQISFLGAGDYHFLTYFLLQKIDRPFALVLLDSHMDYGEENMPLLHCGNWLRWAFDLPLLEQVSVIGARVLSKLPRVTDLEAIPRGDGPLYLSIDKDVLSSEELELSWEQGSWTRQDLQRFLLGFPKGRLVGADVCGEPRLSPEDFSLKATRSIYQSESLNLEIWQVLTV